MKTLKHKSIMGIIYGVLLLMPFLCIFSRVIYVQSNKNAYQSYSGTKVDKIEQINNAQSYVDTFTYNVKPIQTTHGTSPKQKFSTISIENLNVNSTQFSIYSNQTGAYLIMFWDDNNTETERYYWGNPNGNNSFDEFYFTKESGTSLFEYANVFLIYETNEKLDNVFEYSVSQFIDDNNFGKVNLFNWFTDLFLDDNAHNNMYVHYINWYLNYSMLVSCMHLLFLVLMWFVNYSKRLLDRGMNYDW